MRTTNQLTSLVFGRKDNTMTDLDFYKRIEKLYTPDKMSMGNELYSGGVDAKSFRLGFVSAKAMILQEIKDYLAININEREE